MKSNTMKRLLAGTLSAVMVLTNIPASAFASEVTETAVEVETNLAESASASMGGYFAEGTEEVASDAAMQEQTEEAAAANVKEEAEDFFAVSEYEDIDLSDTTDEEAANDEDEILADDQASIDFEELVEVDVADVDDEDEVVAVTDEEESVEEAGEAVRDYADDSEGMEDEYVEPLAIPLEIIDSQAAEGQKDAFIPESVKPTSKIYALALSRESRATWINGFMP